MPPKNWWNEKGLGGRNVWLDAGAGWSWDGRAGGGGAAGYGGGAGLAWLDLATRHGPGRGGPVLAPRTYGTSTGARIC